MRTAGLDLVVLAVQGRPLGRGRAAYQRALLLTANPIEHAFLARRLAAAQGRID